jgi:hypothetical protein
VGSPHGLEEALGIDLELEAAEYAVGGYALDLVGRDVTNNVVLMVENQLAATDHSHLGQVLTYAAGTDASTIVWIATAFREEHRQALDWLNENTGDRTHFFGIELQVVKIGESPNAPLFNVVVKPNDWQKQVRTVTQAGATSERGALYVEFWSRFLERVHAVHPDWTRARSRGPHNWLVMNAPIKGCEFSSSFAQGDRLRHELYIDTGDRDQNLELFEDLHDQEEALEEAYGRRLSWEELPKRRACRIADYREASSVTDDASYDEFMDWFVDAGERFRVALAGIRLPRSA